MRIAFIQPAMGRQSGDGYVASWKMEPLSMATLSSLTRRDRHDVVFWDDRVERIPYDEPVDLVAITCETYTARRAYQIAARFRARGVPVILGGYHPTFLPDEAMRYADSILVGEAEGMWPRMLEDAERRALKPLYRAVGRPSLDTLRPDRSIFVGKNYLPLTLIESGRGCMYSCEFCSITSFYNKSFVPRPAHEVAAEIERTGKKWIFLVDDNISMDGERTKELCRALIPLKIRWFSQATINTGHDPELVDLMKRSGCAGILIGFESIDPQNLKAMNKTFNKGVEHYRIALRRLREAGIKIYATFVFGYDTDAPDLFRRTLDFALEQQFFVAAFNHLQPFPGTALYRRFEREQRLLYPKWWLHEGYHFGQVAYRPKNLAPEELYERLMEIRREFYSVGNIARRALNVRANLLGPGPGWIYLMVNALLRKEIHDKWSTPLGDLGEVMPDFAAEEAA
ncbi:MAG: B12-binding domain-containing radical SAM protein [Polyangia bacterium]